MVKLFETRTGHRFGNLHVVQGPHESCTYMTECKHCQKRLLVDTATNSVYLDIERVAVYQIGTDMFAGLPKSAVCHRLITMM